MTDERNVDAAQIRRERQGHVRPPIQWAYLGGLLVGGMLLMIGLIAVLGSSLR